MSRLIFVVESDTNLRRALRDHLEQGAYMVSAFSAAAGVLAEAELCHPALLVIDTAIAGGGLRLLARIRGSIHVGQTPVVLISPSADEDEMVSGFELGADDYVPVPFSFPEMAARIKAVMRRYERCASLSAIEAGPLQLDRISMTLSIEGKNVPVSFTEFRLLDHLVRHRGRVFSRNQILDAVWGPSNFVTPATVNTHIGRLRLKIESDPAHPRYLKTVHGFGYRFELPLPGAADHSRNSFWKASTTPSAVRIAGPIAS